MTTTAPQHEADAKLLARTLVLSFMRLIRPFTAKMPLWPHARPASALAIGG